MARAGPEVGLLEVAFEVARIAASRADGDELLDVGQPGRLHQVRAHDEVAVIQRRRLGLVDPDPAVVRRGMEEDVAGVFEQAAEAGVERRQVVIPLAGDEDLGAEALEPLDEVLSRGTRRRR